MQTWLSWGPCFPHIASEAVVLCMLRVGLYFRWVFALLQLFHCSYSALLPQIPQKALRFWPLPHCFGSFCQASNHSPFLIEKLQPLNPCLPLSFHLPTFSVSSPSTFMTHDPSLFLHHPIHFTLPTALRFQTPYCSNFIFKQNLPIFSPQMLTQMKPSSACPRPGPRKPLHSWKYEAKYTEPCCPFPP